METPLQTGADKGTRPPLPKKGQEVSPSHADQSYLVLKGSCGWAQLRGEGSLLPPSPLCEMEALTWLQQFWKQWEPISLVQLIMWSVHTRRNMLWRPGAAAATPCNRCQVPKAVCHPQRSTPLSPAPAPVQWLRESTGDEQQAVEPRAQNLFSKELTSLW